ncbi:OLC1v1020593C1 [Oldenlandia corymbosa var. corymbosa]|uniref:Pectinesterase n=1 Tax=Oldenlandia corymbosa var. corymbosa TaxID=529605 RepID=A0AAV1EH00_OLDCO|nr:OLC1v1020593C1 [Oldenlandia corymbosa var. corymbosa]
MESKRAAVIGSCILVLVIGVICAFVYVKTRPIHQNEDAAKSLKAVEVFCEPTRYKETCVRSISSATNSTNATELINVGFQVTMKEIKIAQEKSIALQKAIADPATTDAFETCVSYLDKSVYDLERSLARMNSFDKDDLPLLVDDVKTWLTAAVSYQHTCLDLLENTGENGEKAAEQMRQLMKVGSELTTNTLRMVDQVTGVVEDFSGLNRRLLGESESNELDDYWRRRLDQVARTTPQNLIPSATVELDPKTKKYVNLTIKAALILANKTRGRNVPFIIYVKKGEYHENIEVRDNMRNVMLIGDGPTETKIIGNRNRKFDNINIDKSATVSVDTDHFIAKDIGFENTAGPDADAAVAIRVNSDRSLFYNCHIDGNQDTLYAQNYRQFYRDCSISGTIDFIFGDARAVVQNCNLVIRKPVQGQSCTVVGQGRVEPDQKSATVVQNCRIVADANYPVKDKSYKTYLGRPWKQYSTTLILDSFLPDIIDPAGWLEMGNGKDKSNINTCSLYELGNSGPRKGLSGRVKWPGIKRIDDKGVAENFLPSVFFKSRVRSGDKWIYDAKVPYHGGREKAPTS